MCYLIAGYYYRLVCNGRVFKLRQAVFQGTMAVGTYLDIQGMDNLGRGVEGMAGSDEAISAAALLRYGWHILSIGFFILTGFISIRDGSFTVDGR